MKKIEMYKSIEVWKRMGESKLARYRCFQVLSDGRYCVQSVDYYHLPFEEAAASQHEKQFLELLCEEAPERRTKTFDSLEEAIRTHDQEFENE